MPKGSNNTRASAEERPPCYAAIDLGTNNCRMLVACPGGETNADGFRVIDGYSRIVRLGEGLAASGRLSDEAIERTIKALKVCAGKIRSRGVKETRAIATEACRQAANGDDFLGRVEAETGLTMKIISAVDEAELTVAGCAPLLKTGHPKALIFDIGGGSTELMWIDFPSGGPPKALDILSLPIGVVGLAEEFGKDALAPETFEIIVGRVTRALAPFEDRHRIAAEIEAGGVHMLGTSGTVTTLGAIYLDLPRYDRSRVDGLSIRMESIDAICAKLIGLDYDSRHHHPCIGPGRADLMAMGCAVITAIRRHWPATNLTAADRGIREGLLLEMIATAALAPIEAP
ncbi:MAG TPA: Ppx/GppA phosphatase family protein [Rhodospirillales bacterium]|nr:Ppx/GppA phosphatase family protein [Rhodospirillales bacterium]